MAKKKSQKAKPSFAPPTPMKAPVRAEIVLFPDDTGLAFKDAQILFAFRYPADKFAGGADRQLVQVDESLRKGLSAFFRNSIDAMIEKHDTCSIETAIALPGHPVPAKQNAGA